MKKGDVNMVEGDPNVLAEYRLSKIKTLHDMGVHWQTIAGINFKTGKNRVKHHIDAAKLALSNADVELSNYFTGETATTCKELFQHYQSELNKIIVDL